MKTNDSKNQWTEIVKEYQDSGLSAKDFCLKKELKLPTFYVWKRRLSQEVFKTLHSKKGETSAKGGFVEALLKSPSFPKQQGSLPDPIWIASVLSHLWNQREERS
jgi:hypothetical protein